MLTHTSRSIWDIHGIEPEEVGARMARFAIGALSTMASKNPRIEIYGTRPYLGSRLFVEWPYVISLLMGIAVVHLLLFLLAIYASRVVVVKDDSSLSTARLLRSLVEKMGDSGTVLTGEEISRVIQQAGAGDVVYGPRNVGDTGDYYLDIGNDVVPRRRLKNRRHPDGRYL